MRIHFQKLNSFLRDPGNALIIRQRRQIQIQPRRSPTSTPTTFNPISSKMALHTSSNPGSGDINNNAPTEQQPQTQPDYSTWSHSSLISRIAELEQKLTANTTSPSPSSPAPAPAPARGRNTTTTPPSNSTPHTPSRSSSRRPRNRPRPIDPSKYHTRFIALKFAYLGQRYNGLEHANGNVTPLPTIEEELWKALRKARLIFPTSAEIESDEEIQRYADESLEGGGRRRQLTIDWAGCQYSKCGRTDRGVSAFGQVVGIRVRSARPKRAEKVTPVAVGGGVEEVYDGDNGGGEDPLGGLALSGLSESENEDDGWDDIADELPYITILNRVLPEDIRILAWCPNPPAEFDARFSCRERRYKYFFTQPAFSPTPGALGFLKRGSDGKAAGSERETLREGWLDIEAMREAAKYLVGTHDFRNFCKIDPSKQITNHVRHIYHADIELLDPTTSPLSYLGQPEFAAVEGENREQRKESSSDSTSSTMKVYNFTIHGSAFLWHQVRHLAAILFLVGQGLEKPTIVKELFDVEKNPRRPVYELASDAPLVLWDCIFPDENSGSREDAVKWIYAGDPRSIKGGKGDNKFGIGSTVDNLWRVWRQRKIDEILAGKLLDLAVSQGDKTALARGGFKQASPDLQNRSQKVFYGGNEGKFGGKYVPLMQRQRLETVEVINARYLNKPSKKAAGNSGGDISDHES
ncbi:hypothetical protein FQN55_009504 [Onygenales sp. PD_40]|nr:hypothetical protein FQN55_009504 [Onygenales sp. PD_40]